MNNRYEIIDIIAQDGNGVVFQAEDRDTGQMVVVRRFFPFGLDGGGLDHDEADAYETAVRRLMAISHPALRTVLSGGVDPVDGMPFIVTEWVEGVTLAERLADRPLSPPSAKALADLALETSQILSESFQEESVWIETTADAIILSQDNPERQVTFWISPMRWLSDAESRRGLRPILQMTEEAVGWNRRMLSDGTGEGLGGWIKALRKEPDTWTLEQARYTLHHGTHSLNQPLAPSPSAARGPISPTTATIPAQTAPPQPLTFADKTNWWPWIITGSLGILAIAIGIVFWQASRANNTTFTAPMVATAKGGQDGKPSENADSDQPRMTAAEAASARAAARAAELAKMPNLHAPPGVADAVNEQLIEAGRQMRSKVGQRVAITARLIEVRKSGSGKTLYLEFGSTRSPDALCARYRTSHKVFTAKELNKLVGKLVKVSGEVVADSSGRIAINLSKKNDIVQTSS